MSPNCHLSFKRFMFKKKTKLYVNVQKTPDSSTPQIRQRQVPERLGLIWPRRRGLQEVGFHPSGDTILILISACNPRAQLFREGFVV